MQIIDRLTSQQDGYRQAVRNAYDSISYAQTISQQVSNDILTNAPIALRGQANQSAESILSLL